MPSVDPNVLEGTWEEIRGYESRLAGPRVRVTILDSDDTPAVRVDEKFAALAAQWRAETTWTSSVSQMVMHPAYQEIIGVLRLASLGLVLALVGLFMPGGLVRLPPVYTRLCRWGLVQEG